VRIVIHDVANRFDAQTRAYAERRVFSTLANLTDVLQHAIVRLGRIESGAADGAGNHCIASLSVHLRSGEQLNLDSHGQHPSDAIDRVIGRMSAAVHDKTIESTASGP
jgi:hypothetical protein